MIHQRSHGYALIEMLAVIALTGAIIGLVGVISISLLRSERTSHAEMAEQMTYLRLSRDFRRDVHRAASLEEIADKATSGIRLAKPDGPSVEYRASGNIVSRTAWQKGAETPSVESYDLGRGALPRFARDDAVVSLRFGNDSPVRREVSARLNRDARFDGEGVAK
jgi:type II secretory pathway component PulJ